MAFGVRSERNEDRPVGYCQRYRQCVGGRDSGHATSRTVASQRDSLEDFGFHAESPVHREILLIIRALTTHRGGAVLNVVNSRLRIDPLTIRLFPDFLATSALELRPFLEGQTAEKRHATFEGVFKCP
jgi:hypothetical protein